MKTNLLLMFMIVFLPNIYSQKGNKADKWRTTEKDTFSVAQAMFDDQNFVMAFPYLDQLQQNHPNDELLKYMTGICCLFREDKHSQGLAFLLDVYKNNKNAEDIEYYVALAYHYNGKFDEAIDIVDIYLARKHLTKPQIRGAEKLKDFCQRKETIVPAPDEGKLDDYVKLDVSEEK